MLHNPSLREEPLDQPAAVIPHKQETSILSWLESTGRLVARDDQVIETTDIEPEDFVGFDDEEPAFDFDDDDPIVDLDEE